MVKFYAILQATKINTSQQQSNDIFLLIYVNFAQDIFTLIQYYILILIIFMFTSIDILYFSNKSLSLSLWETYLSN